MLVDRDLGEPDEDIRIPSWNRFMKIEAESPSSNKSSPEDENAKKSCFSFLSLLRSSSSLSTSSPSQSFHSPSLRMKRKHPSHVTSPIPPWIWDMYSPSNLVLRVKQELSKLSSLSPNMSSVPSDPTQLSWWATANLPFEVRKFCCPDFCQAPGLVQGQSQHSKFRFSKERTYSSQNPPQFELDCEAAPTYYTCIFRMTSEQLFFPSIVQFKDCE